MPDPWPYTRPEVTELVLKRLAQHERLQSTATHPGGWLTTGAICADMLEIHRVRLDREYLEEILHWLVVAGCVSTLPIDVGSGSIQRWRITAGVNHSNLIREAGVPGG